MQNATITALNPIDQIVNIFINGSNFEYWTIVCDTNNTCNVDCQTSNACSELRLVCDGQCNVTCAESQGIECPIIIPTSSPTAVPTAIPTAIPTYNPTSIPTYNPTADKVITMTFTASNPSNEYGSVSLITNNGRNAVEGGNWYCIGESGDLSWCLNLELKSNNSALSIYGMNITMLGSQNGSGIDFFVTYAAKNQYFSLAFDLDGYLALDDNVGGVFTAPACGTSSGIFSVSSATDANGNSTIFDVLDGVSLFSGGSWANDFQAATAGGNESNYGLLTSEINSWTTPHFGMINNFDDNEIEISFESDSIPHTSCTLHNTSFGEESVVNVLLTPDHDDDQITIQQIEVVLFLG